jgi:hypothetical protein
MSQSKTIMLAQGSTGPGPAHSLQLDFPNRGYVLSVGGVNAPVTASVAIEVSTDGVTWAQRLLFSLSGTSTTSVPVVHSDVDLNSPFPLVRANLLSITGGGFVTVSVTASDASAGNTDFRRTSDGAQTWVGVGDDHAIVQGLGSGEDQSHGWQATVSAASRGQHVMPINTATAGTFLPNSNVGLGTTGGAVGDYLKSLRLNITSATNAAVYLSQANQVNVVAGTSGTDPTAATSVTLVSAIFNAAANKYAGYILSITYTPTGGAAGTVVKKKIVSHVAFSSATSLTFTVTDNLPAGATITAWALEPIATSYEVVPFNQPVGILVLPIDERSTLGGWQLSIGTGVEAHATGWFS